MTFFFIERNISTNYEFVTAQERAPANKSEILFFLFCPFGSNVDRQYSEAFEYMLFPKGRNAGVD